MIKTTWWRHKLRIPTTLQLILIPFCEVILTKNAWKREQSWNLFLLQAMTKEKFTHAPWGSRCLRSVPAIFSLDKVTTSCKPHIMSHNDAVLICIYLNEGFPGSLHTTTSSCMRPWKFMKLSEPYKWRCKYMNRVMYAYEGVWRSVKMYMYASLWRCMKAYEGLSRCQDVILIFDWLPVIQCRVRALHAATVMLCDRADAMIGWFLVITAF